MTTQQTDTYLALLSQIGFYIELMRDSGILQTLPQKQKDAWLQMRQALETLQPVRSTSFK